MLSRTLLLPTLCQDSLADDALEDAALSDTLSTDDADLRQLESEADLTLDACVLKAVHHLHQLLHRMVAASIFTTHSAQKDLRLILFEPIILLFS